jgi:putative FmdB family regulatory protein
VPTYQYSCTTCGHFFETVQSFSDDSLTVCPECGGKLRKVFNAVGVVFKGSGFYRNDSRGKQPGNDGASPEAAPSSPKPDSKPESKPAAKSDSSSGSSGSAAASPA